MDLKRYFKSLSADEKDRYARRAGTTLPYLRLHLIPKRKVPRPDLMTRLASASNGNVSREEVLEHFYSPKGEDAAA